MQRNINSLIGYNMGATDGIIGQVEDFYFDDESWTIRYLILKTGNWSSGRKVLISTGALEKPSWKMQLFPVNLTKQQIHSSSDIDTDKPVFRQHEHTLNDYYSWGNYWEDGYYLGGIWCVEPVLDKKGLIERNKPDEQSHDDRRLRSCNQVAGYHIHASDGDIGHVTDFIIDDQNWQVKSIVVDTHNWFGGKKVLIDVERITEVEWNNSKVFVDITTDSIKNSIDFDESKFIHPKIIKTVDVDRGHSF